MKVFGFVTFFVRLWGRKSQQQLQQQRQKEWEQKPRSLQMYAKLMCISLLCVILFSFSSYNPLANMNFRSRTLICVNFVCVYVMASTVNLRHIIRASGLMWSRFSLCALFLLFFLLFVRFSVHSHFIMYTKVQTDTIHCWLCVMIV